MAATIDFTVTPPKLPSDYSKQKTSQTRVFLSSLLLRSYSSSSSALFFGHSIIGNKQSQLFSPNSHQMPQIFITISLTLCILSIDFS